MVSKTRLSSYCTKQRDDTVNLVTSRKTIARLVRPITIQRHVFCMAPFIMFKRSICMFGSFVVDILGKTLIFVQCSCLIAPLCSYVNQHCGTRMLLPKAGRKIVDWLLRAATKNAKQMRNTKQNCFWHSSASPRNNKQWSAKQYFANQTNMCLADFASRSDLFLDNEHGLQNIVEKLISDTSFWKPCTQPCDLR